MKSTLLLLLLTSSLFGQTPAPKPMLNPEATAIRAKMITELRAHPFPSTGIISSINNTGAILGDIETTIQDPKTGNMIAFTNGFIVGLGRGEQLVDGDTWKGTLYLAGVYKTAFGGTIRRFALTPEIAADLQIAEKLNSKSKAANPVQ